VVAPELDEREQLAIERAADPEARHRDEARPDPEDERRARVPVRQGPTLDEGGELVHGDRHGRARGTRALPPCMRAGAGEAGSGVAPSVVREGSRAKWTGLIRIGALEPPRKARQA
jgi:hypothetical protein